jgi:hypothetical protein
MSTNPTIPTNRPANAIGFVTTHHRRTERLAMYDIQPGAKGANFFAADATLDQIGTALATQGFTLLEDGFVVGC